MTTPQKKWFIRGAIAVAVIAVALTLWQLLKPGGLPDGIIGGNGRIEAIEIDISAKTPGRIRDIVADEGDFVKAGRSEEHTSELQSLMRISYAVFCLKKKTSTQ